MRQEGVYRGWKGNPVRLVRATDPDEFQAMAKWWSILTWVFSIGCVLDAIMWVG